MSEVATVNILGVPVQAHTIPSLLERLAELISAPGAAAAYGVNAHSLNLTYRHPEYLEALRHADLVYADGASLQLGAKILGDRIPEKLTTTDLWPRLCDAALRRGYRFFLLGGEEGLAERAASKAKEQYPELQIVGTRHGYFDPDDSGAVDAINEARADVLWVGMGDPRQVLWCEHVKERLGVGLAITCGGMFRIVAGELKRVDERWRRRGFEWFFRLLQEPRYTWRRYLLGLPAFGFRIAAQRLLGHRKRLGE